MTTTQISPANTATGPDPADDGTATRRDEQRRDALAERLFASALAGAELLTVDLGRQLGYYAALHADGPATASELAGRTGTTPRYALEWLEQQAAAGLLDVVEPHAVDRAARRFALPAGHVPVLIDEDHPAHLMGTAPLLAGLALTLPAVEQAYRSGGGVPYAAFGVDFRHGLAAFNRPGYVGELADWLSVLPDVTDRLRAGGAVLDLGCGEGWSSIAIARAFPRTTVDGVDLDAGSVAQAQRHAAEAGVADRVRFFVGDAAAVDVGLRTGPYDLACIFEALHDMGEPVHALAAIRRVLADGAPLLVADERTADEFCAPAGEIERLQYAFSVLHCLPATMAESTAVASGTVLRAPTVRAWGRSAGYRAVEVLPIENDVFRFYRFDA